MSAILLKQKREERAKKIADAKALMDAAGKAKTELTQEQSAAVDKLLDEADLVKREIDKIDTEERRQSRLAEAERDLSKVNPRKTEADDPVNPKDPEARGDDQPIDFEVRGQKMRLHPGTMAHRRSQPKIVEEFRGFIRDGSPTPELRALQSDVDTAGGFLVTPEVLAGEMIKNLDDEVHMRRLARRFVIQAAGLGAVTRHAKLSTFAWGGEITAPTADTALKFGKRQLTPHQMVGEIVVSADLIRSAIMSPETIVFDELARDAGELEERAFMTGHGAGQPLGIFTASADGISTARDVSADNTSTAFTCDGIINALYALKPSDRAKAEWMFHRDGIRNVRKLKDSANQYIWQPADKPNQPDTLLGKPLNESEWCPNTFTTGLYVGIVGNFSAYWIVDSLVFLLQRLVELHARTNQVGFIARRKVDGAPVREEAFARVKLA